MKTEKETLHNLTQQRWEMRQFSENGYWLLRDEDGKKMLKTTMHMHENGAHNHTVKKVIESVPALIRIAKIFQGYLQELDVENSLTSGEIKALKIVNSTLENITDECT